MQSRIHSNKHLGFINLSAFKDLTVHAKDLYRYLMTYFCLFAFSWATPMAYGGSQARGPIGAVAAGLRQSHSNMGSELCLQSTPQLTTTPDR